MTVNFTLLIPNNADTNVSLYGFFLSNMPLGLDYRSIILIDRPKVQIGFITESKKHPDSPATGTLILGSAYKKSLETVIETADKHAHVIQWDSKDH